MLEIDFLATATAIGELVATKNAAYVSAFADSPKHLELLWPHGVPSESYGDMLLIVRILDKFKRIATDKDALGESPWHDVAGYGVIGATLNARPINSGGALSLDCGRAFDPDEPSRTCMEPRGHSGNCNDVPF